ncbi:MAG TPA: hypothetical protein VIV11_17950, partial [Kofleriaceae bacterium]
GPFVLVPVLMCGMVIAVCNIPWVNDRPWALYVWTALLALTPSLLEWAGLIAPTTVVKDGYYVLRSAIVAAGGRIDVLALVLVNLVLMLAVARFAHALARDRRTAFRQLTVQAWHLDHLLPKGGVFST